MKNLFRVCLLLTAWINFNSASSMDSKGTDPEIPLNDAASLRAAIQQTKAEIGELSKSIQEGIQALVERDVSRAREIAALTERLKALEEVPTTCADVLAKLEMLEDKDKARDIELAALRSSVAALTTDLATASVTKASSGYSSGGAAGCAGAGCAVETPVRTRVELGSHYPVGIMYFQAHYLGYDREDRESLIRTLATIEDQSRLEELMEASELFFPFVSVLCKADFMNCRFFLNEYLQIKVNLMVSLSNIAEPDMRRFIAVIFQLKDMRQDLNFKGGFVDVMARAGVDACEIIARLITRIVKADSYRPDYHFNVAGRLAILSRIMPDGYLRELDEELTPENLKALDVRIGMLQKILNIIFSKKTSAERLALIHSIPLLERVAKPRTVWETKEPISQLDSFINREYGECTSGDTVFRSAATELQAAYISQLFDKSRKRAGSGR